MEEWQFRNKVTWFAFCFSVLVIWSHAYNAELFLGETAQAAQLEKIERFFGELIAQIAVPGFFMISSYLFYRNFKWEGLIDKWKSRISSLVIPYLIWNSIYYIGYVIASSIPVLRDAVGKGNIPFRADLLFDAAINHTYNYVFWYLKQLIILVALTPVIYMIAKRFITTAAILAITWNLINIQYKLPGLNLDALFYYLAAAFVALNYKTCMAAIWTKKRALAGAALLGAGIYFYIIYLRRDQVGFLVIYRTLIPAGLWCVLPENLFCKVKPWMNINFFLYVVHFAIVRVINKTIALSEPALPFVPFFVYISMPVIIVCLAYMTATILQKYRPVVWRIITGQRY